MILMQMHCMVWAGHGAVMVQLTKDRQKFSSTYLSKQILSFKQYRNLLDLLYLFLCFDF